MGSIIADAVEAKADQDFARVGQEVLEKFDRIAIHDNELVQPEQTDDKSSGEAPVEEAAPQQQVEEQSTDEPESTEAESQSEKAEFKFDSWDSKIVMPDGTEATLDQINKERMLHSDYTRKRQEDSRFALELENFKRNLEQQQAFLSSKEQEIQRNGEYISKLVDLSKKHPEFREELGTLLETYGEKAAASEAKLDPTVTELRIKLRQIEEERMKERAASEEEKKNADRQNLIRQFNETLDKLVAEKFKFADKREVRALVVSGEFEKMEDALKYSHEKGLAKRQADEKKVIAKKAEEKKTAIPPVDQGRSTTPVEQKTKGKRTFQNPDIEQELRNLYSSGVVFK